VNHALKSDVSPPENGVATPELRSVAEHEQLYREIIDTAQEGIWIANDRGEITFANQRMAAMLGYGIEEMIHQPLSRFFAGPAAETNDRSERHLLRKDGSSFWAIVDTRRIYGGEGDYRGMRASVVDVTARRTAQEQLQFRETQLLDAQGEVSALGRLASAVAQEFNVLLIGMQPFIDVIARTEDPRVRGAAAHVIDGVARGKRITNDVMKFTRLVEPSPRVLNAATWMRNVEGDIAHVAGARVIVRSDIPPDLRMLADPQQLAEVFRHIAANARDAMPRGGALTVSAWRETQARPVPDPPRESVHFALRDTGTGIPPRPGALSTASSAAPSSSPPRSAPR